MSFILACLSGMTGCCRCEWCCCPCCQDVNDGVSEAMEPMANSETAAVQGAASAALVASPTLANAAQNSSPLRKRSVSFALLPVEPIIINSEEYVSPRLQPTSPRLQPSSPTRGIIKKSSFSDIPDDAAGYSPRNNGKQVRNAVDLL